MTLMVFVWQQQYSILYVKQKRRWQILPTDFCGRVWIQRKESKKTTRYINEKIVITDSNECDESDDESIK